MGEHCLLCDIIAIHEHEKIQMNMVGNTQPSADCILALLCNWCYGSCLTDLTFPTF